MARIKLKQILSNLHYDADNDQLILSGSKVPTANYIWNEVTNTWEESFGDWDGSRNSIPDFVIRGNTVVTSSLYSDASLTVFGDITANATGSYEQ
jgi:hypothetical protein